MVRTDFSDERGWEAIRSVAIADGTAMAPPDHALLLLSLNPYEEPRGSTFRALPSKLGGIATNLSLGNMDFREFAESAGPDGVFRGFSFGG